METTRLRDATETNQRTGPILFLHGADAQRLQLAALLIHPEADAPPELTTDDGPAPARRLHRRGGYCVTAYSFSLPTEKATGYRLDGEQFPVNTDFAGNVRIAYVSCNGQEEGDRERPVAERNVLWRRLAEEHTQRPFQLLLHGGDQLYADEMLKTHPSVSHWSVSHRHHDSDDDNDPAILSKLRDHLFERYRELYNEPAVGWLMARVPSLTMWDDHDICDGWGSLPDRKLDCAVGQAVFRAAREAFLIFQMGTLDDPLPPICRDETGDSLTWSVHLPQLHIAAPDLRSQRRRHQVMAPSGWDTLRRALQTDEDGHVFVLSSVPALGPRLSWVEALMMLTPHMQKYEDDLRDQWQSRAHRAEWRAFLQTLLDVHCQRTPVTVLSGEIHLATRATMAAAPSPIHQLVASGIAHPPPPQAYARVLGGLARLGEAPLPAHRISLHPLPGQRRIYTAQRNYLVLERRAGDWTAHWELEDDGPTPALSLGGG